MEWQNPGPTEVAADIRFKLCQAGGLITAPVSEGAWKKLRILPGQTVLETGSFDFPSVRGRTAFILKFYDGVNDIGAMQVQVYPTNLLNELKMLAADRPVGVLEENNMLKTLLNFRNIETADLLENGLSHFEGKLAMVGSPGSTNALPNHYTSKIPEAAMKGMGVVWIQPERSRRTGTIQPSFYVVPRGRGAVVVVQQDFLSDLENNPISQLRLIECCRLAVKSEAPHLPGTRQESEY